MKKVMFLFAFFLLLLSCETESAEIESEDDNSKENTGNDSNDDDDSDEDQFDGSTWLLPVDEIYDGGPGKDGIPALEEPESFPSRNEIHNYLSDDDLILGIEYDGTIKAYPHPILDWHEIINDRIRSHNYAINYCPLTGTGMAWDRRLKESVTTFGVSGLLYNTNLILYDRLTDSYWSQMSLMAVRGELSGDLANVYSTVEMTWGTWKSIYPDKLVAGPSKEHSRPYGKYPYGDYKTDDNYYLFPVNKADPRLPNKERVFAIIEDTSNVKIYRYTADPLEYFFIEDFYQNREYVIAGLGNDFMVAFEPTTTDAEKIELRLLRGKLPLIFEDNSGSRWDIFGNALEGPNEGKKLKEATFINGFWFTFPAFFDNVDLYVN